MSITSVHVRPRAEYLRQLPTLETITQQNWPFVLEDLPPERKTDFTLELKLVTADAKYWLCTKGLPEPLALTPQEMGWQCGVRLPDTAVVGYVTIEPREPDENGICELRSYGPKDTTWFQAMDYWRMLDEELRRLQKQHQRKQTWDLVKQIDATVAEMEKVDEQMKRMQLPGN
jgi:hypothetical protein